MSNVFPGQFNVTGNNKTNNETEVTSMNALQEQLFLELRQTQLELESSLKSKQKDHWMMDILEDELADITAALDKLAAGNYGQCENSGLPLPDHMLKTMPTIKTTKDSENMEHYFRKPINSSFF
jgi:RNA polymerase-binding transcription factor DksA